MNHPMIGLISAAMTNASKANAPAALNVRMNDVNTVDRDVPHDLSPEEAVKLGVPEGEAMRILADVTVLKRFGEPYELAAAVVFLASARASFMTGIMLDVDGGQVQGI